MLITKRPVIYGKVISRVTDSGEPMPWISCAQSSASKAHVTVSLLKHVSCQIHYFIFFIGCFHIPTIGWMWSRVQDVLQYVDRKQLYLCLSAQHIWLQQASCHTRYLFGAISMLKIPLNLLALLIITRTLVVCYLALLSTSLRHSLPFLSYICIVITSTI